MNYSSLQLLGINWSNTNSKPRLRLLDTGQKDAEKTKVELFSGLKFTIRVHNERRCIGSFGQSCPDHALMDASRMQCFNCSREEGKIIMPVSVLNEEEKAYLRTQPHFNYLVIFGGGTIKTGVAHEDRKTSRLLEQGGFANLYFASCNGLESRQIEDFVSKQFKIPQVVNWNTKLKNALSRAEEAELKGNLMEIFDRIVKGSSIKEFINPPEFAYHYDKYQLNLPEEQASIRLIKNIVGGELLSGEIIGIYGKVLLFRAVDSFIYGINIGDLRGFLVDLTVDEGIVPQSEVVAKEFAFMRQVENLTLF